MQHKFDLPMVALCVCVHVVFQDEFMTHPISKHDAKDSYAPGSGTSLVTRGDLGHNFTALHKVVGPTQPSLHSPESMTTGRCHDGGSAQLLTTGPTTAGDAWRHAHANLWLVQAQHPASARHRHVPPAAAFVHPAHARLLSGHLACCWWLLV